jgi:hypothetical protein
MLPHIELEHRKDWSETWHLKEMTENDVDNLQKYIGFPIEIKRTLLCLISWVTRQTRSENTWTQEKEDTYAEGAPRNKSALLQASVPPALEQMSQLSAPASQTEREVAEAVAVGASALCGRGQAPVSDTSMPQAGSMVEMDVTGADLLCSGSSGKRVMLNDLWDYLTLHNVEEFAKQWFVKHWRHTWELKNMTDNDFVDLNKYAQTLNPPERLKMGPRKRLQVLIDFVKMQTQETNVMTQEKEDQFDGFYFIRNKPTEERRPREDVDPLQNGTQMMMMNPYFVKLTL